MVRRESGDRLGEPVESGSAFGIERGQGKPSAWSMSKASASSADARRRSQSGEGTRTTSEKRLSTDARASASREWSAPKSGISSRAAIVSSIRLLPHPAPPTTRQLWAPSSDPARRSTERTTTSPISYDIRNVASASETPRGRASARVPTETTSTRSLILLVIRGYLPRDRLGLAEAQLAAAFLPDDEGVPAVQVFEADGVAAGRA